MSRPYGAGGVPPYQPAYGAPPGPPPRPPAQQPAGYPPYPPAQPQQPQVQQPAQLDWSSSPSPPAGAAAAPRDRYPPFQPAVAPSPSPIPQYRPAMAAPTPPPVPAGVVQSSFYAAAPTAPAQPAYPPAPVHNQPQSFTPVPPAQGQRPFDAAIPLDERPSDFYSQTVLAAATRAQPTSFYDPRSRPVMRDVTAELPKRSAVIKTVDLTAKGNLQIDIPVPPRLLEFADIKRGWEVEHMRYTAATCDPDDFAAAGYTLRPQEMGRETELFIVMTMYNEGEEEFINTMYAVIANIKGFLGRTKSAVWGPKAWEKIVVCVISDGRTKINPRTQNLLAAMGLYQDGVYKNQVDGKKVTAHITEYTSQVEINHDLRVSGTVPIQTIFLLKEENAKKINSHRWAFNALCPILQPNVVVLLDVGTRPLDTALYHLWKVFDRHPNVGGACGEIRADIGKGWENCINPLVAAQNFEYKISNQLDKPLESAFGYISVLPGAFSAYRYRALTDYAPGVGPLSSYFMGEALHSGKIDGTVVKNNMYLAEDRILCFELVAKPGQAWVLRYERAAAAVTDVPDKFAELVSQRRRWLNGSNFAALYALTNWMKIWGSAHGFGRKIAFMFEGVYQALVMLFAWFSIGNFYLTFFFLMNSQILPDGINSDPSKMRMPYYPAFGAAGAGLFYFFNAVYMFLFIGILVISLGNRPQGSGWLYPIMTGLWALIFGIMMYAVLYSIAATINIALAEVKDYRSNFWDQLGNFTFLSTILGLGSTYGLWILVGILFLDPWHLINSFFQSLFLMPFWVNILQTYAMCNTHDFSWGTKGDNAGAVAHDLGGVKKADGAGGAKAVELELPDASSEASNRFYQGVLESFHGGMQKKPQGSSSISTEDSYKLFRTNVVLAWLFSNLAIIIVFTNPTVVAKTTTSFCRRSTGFEECDKSQVTGQDVVLFSFNGYVSFLFYASAFFALVKFIGTIYYLIVQQAFDRKSDANDTHIGNVLAKKPDF